MVYAKIQAPHWGMSFAGALHNVFLNLYDWPPFVLALGTPLLLFQVCWHINQLPLGTGFSLVGVVLMAGLENLIGFRLLGQYELAQGGDDAVDDKRPLRKASPSEQDPIKPALLPDTDVKLVPMV